MRALREHGVGAGDGVALLCANRTEFVEVFWATRRSGMRMTPINWRLTGEEAAYIANDCDAKVFIADARFRAAAEHVAANAPRATLRVAIGGAIPGFESYEALLRDRDGSDIPDPQLGTSMLYTSGTTGKPKGVYRSSAPPTSPSLVGKRRLSPRREHPSRHRSAVSRRAVVAVDGRSAAVRRSGRADGRLGQPSARWS